MAEGDSEVTFSKGLEAALDEGGDNLGELTDDPGTADAGNPEPAQRDCFGALTPAQMLPSQLGNLSSTPMVRQDNLNDNPRHVKMVVKPETYEGKGDWAEYLSHFNDCAELGGWDNKVKCLVLAANLRGAARKYYTGLGREEKKDYNRLILALKKRFGGEHRQDSWLSRLEMRKRRSGEAVADLGDDIWQMAQRAYYDFDQRSQEQLALKHFYRVIESDMKVKCVENRCTNIFDAVDVMERYEALYEDRKESRKTSVRAVEATKQMPTADLGRIMEQLEKMDARQTRWERVMAQSEANLPQRGGVSRERTYKDRACYHCGEKDHFISACPHRDQPRQPGQSNAGQDSGRTWWPRQSAGNSRPSN